MSLTAPAWGSLDNPNADSYVTVAEADAYMSAREGYSPGEWSTLTTAQKELRLKWATMLVDSLRYRGVKATKLQTLAFPRIFPQDSFLWPEDTTASEAAYEDYPTLLEYLDDYLALGIDVETDDADTAWEVGDTLTLTIAGTTTRTATVDRTAVEDEADKGDVAGSVTGPWPAETLTLTATSATTFSCTGSISGTHPDITVNTTATLYFKYPAIPEAVKTAVYEIAYQVVSQYLIGLDPFESAEETPRSITVGKLSVQFAGQTTATGTIAELFNKMSLSAATIIRLYLQNYLTKLRAAII